MTITKATMLRAAILIDHLRGFNVEWRNYVRAFEIPREQIPGRLFQSQYYQNDDYHSCVLGLFENILMQMPKMGRDLQNMS